MTTVASSPVVRQIAAVAGTRPRDLRVVARVGASPAQLDPFYDAVVAIARRLECESTQAEAA